METRRKEGARLREPSARRAFPEVRVVSLVAGVHRGEQWVVPPVLTLEG